VSDCLEARERSAYLKFNKQWLFHLDIDLPHRWDENRKRYIKDIISQKQDLELITFQATRCCDQEKVHNGIFQLEGHVYSRPEMLENAERNVLWLRNNVSADLKMGIENNNYYPSRAYDFVTDGDFISDLSSQNDLFLLFDIAHAIVTAHNRKCNYTEYCNSLPLNRVVQLHVCQPAINRRNLAYDAHDEPDDEMFKNVLSLVREFSSIDYLTIEYYKDKDILIKSLNKLRKLISANIDG